VFAECNADQQRSVLRSFCAKELNVKDISKQIFPVYGGKCFRVRRFTIGLRNFLKDALKSQMMPDKVGEWL
jgi:hypothetical protein